MLLFSCFSGDVFRKLLSDKDAYNQFLLSLDWLKFKTMWVGILLYAIHLHCDLITSEYLRIGFLQLGIQFCLNSLAAPLSLSLSLKLRVLSELDNWFQIACLWWESQGLCMKIGTANFFEQGFQSCHYWWTQSLEFRFHFLLCRIVFCVLTWGDNLLKVLSWFGIIRSKEVERTCSKSEFKGLTEWNLKPSTWDLAELNQEEDHFTRLDWLVPIPISALFFSATKQHILVIVIIIASII